MNYTIAIHGGAGYLTRENISPEKEAGYRQALSKALAAGEAVLKNDGTALDAVETAIRILEDDPLFNAGRGSVFTYDGANEMDAAIMEGHTLRAGAVARVKKVRNPIAAARLIMEQSANVLLVGQGADAFAGAHGLPLEPPDYFYDEFRYQQYLRLRGTGKQALDHTKDDKYGTVGAVAVDRSGHLAAGTSTGGMTNKRYGRVGDSPIIGAGTYANHQCAISATGHGEYFMRTVLAHDIAAMAEYQGLQLSEAVSRAIHQKSAALGGEGGVIAVNDTGEVVMDMNTRGMFRGWVKEGAAPEVAVFRE